MEVLKMPENKKTAEYTRRAIDNYKKKFDQVLVNLPKGSKERIKAINPDITPGAFVRDAAIKELERIENKNKTE